MSGVLFRVKCALGEGGGVECSEVCSRGGGGGLNVLRLITSPSMIIKMTFSCNMYFNTQYLYLNARHFWWNFCAVWDNDIQMEINFCLLMKTVFSHYSLRSTDHEALHYEVFSTPLLPRPSKSQIFSSTPYSQTPSAYALQFCQQTLGNAKLQTSVWKMTGAVSWTTLT
jgi:hypothetical protein